MSNKRKKEGSVFQVLVKIVASLLIVSGLVLGVWFYFFNENNEATNDAQIEQYVTPIVSRVTGYVKQVRYEENQLVHKGDTLVLIDNSEYQTKLDAALADLNLAKQNQIVAQKNVITTAGTTSINEAQLHAAKTNLWKTKLEFERYQALVAEEAATNQQLEKVKADYEAAQAHFQEMQNRIHLSNLTTSQAAANVPSAHTVIEAKQALVDNAALFLSYTVITAPYDGWVGKKTIQNGQLIKEGQSLVSMVSKEKWVVANFKETQLQYLSVGQTVTVDADALPGCEFEGVVLSFSPASGARFSLLPPDNATGNFVKIEQRIPVKISLKNHNAKADFLRAGMNVKVVIAHR